MEHNLQQIIIYICVFTLMIEWAYLVFFSYKRKSNPNYNISKRSVCFLAISAILATLGICICLSYNS